MGDGGGGFVAGFEQVWGFRSLVDGLIEEAAIDLGTTLAILIMSADRG